MKIYEIQYNKGCDGQSWIVLAENEEQAWQFVPKKREFCTITCLKSDLTIPGLVTDFDVELYG